MTSVTRINHVAIVVEDIEAALHFWRDGLGLEVAYVEDVPDQDSVVAFLPTGPSEVELVKPTKDESGIGRYLHRRGPGMHHICFEVDDIEACLQRLKKMDIRLINDEPVIGTGGKKIAFIHPDSTHGVLVELYQLTAEEPRIRMERARKLARSARTRSQMAAAGMMAFLRSLRVGGNGKED